MKNYTQKLLFRSLEKEDLDWLMKIENDPKQWEHGDRHLPLSRSIFESFIHNAAENLESAGQFRWVIEELETSKPIGLLDLYEYTERHQRAGVGILIEEEYRGHGYAKDALLWLSDYCKNVVGMHQLYAEITADNPGSVHVFDSAGFIQSGLKKEWMRKGPSFVDLIDMQKLL